jgi:hypothetical protein
MDRSLHSGSNKLQDVNSAFSALRISNSTIAIVGQHPIHEIAEEVIKSQVKPRHMKRIDLAFKDALRVMNAELWLRLGERREAMRELRRLKRRAWRHPWVQRVFIAARTSV